MKRGSRTARDFLKELENNPVYQARRAAQEREMSELRAICAADQAGLIQEIRQIGYDIDSIWDFVNNDPHPLLERRFVGEYPNAYPILIRHLQHAHHRRVREGIIRALTVNDGGQSVEHALLREFTHEKDPGLRWVLANALSVAMPYRRRKKHPDIALALKKGGTA
jgi:hypothetical protein